jgi:hypothetical protein
MYAGIGGQELEISYIAIEQIADVRERESVPVREIGQDEEEVGRIVWRDVNTRPCIADPAVFPEV